MAAEDYKYLVLAYIEKINERDAAGLSAMMTPNFSYIDSLGFHFDGRDAMPDVWERYFSMFPDYTINVTHILREGDIVAALGTARGTYIGDGELLPENAWEIPAAWKATVREGKIAVWHVYADNEPIRRIIEQYKTSSEK